MNMLKKFKLNNKIKFLIIQISFIVISIFFASRIIYSHEISPSNDSIFNYQRLVEVFTQLMQFKWPQFSVNTCIPIGIATPSFYPWLIFAPFAPLILICHEPLTIWSIIIIAGMFVGLNVSYYSCISIYKSRKLSYIFSIFYCISTMELAYMINASDFGQYMGTLFVPLAFFGWIHWIKSGKWKMMTIGLILICFCHILTFLIMLVSLYFLTLLFIDKIKWNKARLKSYIYSSLIVLLTTSVVWIPIVELMIHNSIMLPRANLRVLNNFIPVIPNSAMFLIFPWTCRVWSFSDIISIILIIIYWKRLNYVYKRFSIFAFFYILLNIKPIKLFLILHTPLIHIQFMYRICFISHLLLTLILVNIIVNILLKRWFIQNVCALLFVLFALMVGCIFLTCVSPNLISNYKTFNYQNISNPKIWSLRANKIRNKIERVHLNNKVLNSKNIITYSPNVDYAPSTKNNKWLEVIESTKNHRMQDSVDSKSNGILTFYNNIGKGKILLPILIYKGQKYLVRVNGKVSNYSYSRKYKCLELSKIRKGYNQIQVKPKVMAYRYVSLVLTFIGILLLVLL